MALMFCEWQRYGFYSLALLAILSCWIVLIGNASLYQKYFDFPALLISCLIVFQKEDGMRGAKRCILFFYCLCFTAYALGASVIRGEISN
jgi:hypothetical protein